MNVGRKPGRTTASPGREVPEGARPPAEPSGGSRRTISGRPIGRALFGRGTARVWVRLRQALREGRDCAQTVEGIANDFPPVSAPSRRPVRMPAPVAPNWKPLLTEKGAVSDLSACTLLSRSGTGRVATHVRCRAVWQGSRSMRGRRLRALDRASPRTFPSGARTIDIARSAARSAKIQPTVTRAPVTGKIRD